MWCTQGTTLLCCYTMVIKLSNARSAAGSKQLPERARATCMLQVQAAQAGHLAAGRSRLLVAVAGSKQGVPSATHPASAGCLLQTGAVTDMTGRMIVMREMFLQHIQIATEANKPFCVEDEAIVIILTRGSSVAQRVRDAGGAQNGTALSKAVEKNYLNRVEGRRGRYWMTQTGIEWCLENIGGIALVDLEADN